VATVGDYSITAEDLNAGFSSRPQSFTSYEYELEQRLKYLEGMIDQKLLVIGAYQQGLENNQEIQRLIEQQQTKFLLDQLYKQEIADKVVVTDEQVRAFYERMGEEIHARHILTTTEAEAQAVRTELEAEDADFAAIARAKSKDPSAAQNGGDLSWFRWGAMVPPFQEAAFALGENEISQPVQTSFGWHVIQLLGRRQVDRQPFDQARAPIEQQLQQMQTQERLMEFLEAVKGKAILSLDTAQLALVQETYRDPDGPLSFKSNLDPNELNEKIQLRPIARYLDTSLSTGDFLRMANQAPPMNRPDFYDTTAVKDLMWQMIYARVLEHEARRLRIDHSDEYQQALERFRETLMADKMRNDLQQRPVDVSPEELQAYYDDHPEEFSSPPQVRMREALVATQEEASEIITRVRRGSKFAEICGEVTLRPGMKAKKGDLGTFRRFEHPNLFDAAQKMEVGQVGGPIYHATQSGGQWSVVELMSKQDAVIRTFEEVRDNILNKLKNEKRTQALETWLAEMRESTRVDVNDEAVAATIDASRYPEKG
jgi:peptidyl-prolyl cis-trans isomerase C